MLEIFYNKGFSKIKKASEILSLLVPEPVNSIKSHSPIMVHPKMNLNQSLEDPKFLSLGEKKKEREKCK